MVDNTVKRRLLLINSIRNLLLGFDDDQTRLRGEKLEKKLHALYAEANEPEDRDLKIANARIIVLQAALVEAQNIVAFLESCLLDPDHYTHANPNSSEQALAYWATLASPIYEGCGHSRYEVACQGCCERVSRATKLFEAKEILKGI